MASNRALVLTVATFATFAVAGCGSNAETTDSVPKTTPALLAPDQTVIPGSTSTDTTSTTTTDTTTTDTTATSGGTAGQTVTPSPSTGTATPSTGGTTTPGTSGGTGVATGTTTTTSGTSGTGGADFSQFCKTNPGACPGQ